MKEIVLAVLTAIGVTAFAASGASAMPIAPPAAASSNIEPVHMVCNAWGRCWWRPNDYGYGYGYYRHDDDDWRHRYRYRYSDDDDDHPHHWGGYGYRGYGRWHHDQGDQGEDED